MNEAASTAVKAPIDRAKYFSDMGITQDGVSRAIKQFEHFDDSELPIVAERDYLNGKVKIVWRKNPASLAIHVFDMNAECKDA